MCMTWSREVTVLEVEWCGSAVAPLFLVEKASNVHYSHEAVGIAMLRGSEQDSILGKSQVEGAW